MKILLNKQDFDFVKIYSERHNIPEGTGKIRDLELFLNYYKNYIQEMGEK